MNRSKSPSIRLAVILLTQSLAATAAEIPDSVQQLREVAVTVIKQPSLATMQPTARTEISSDEIDRMQIVSMKQVSEIAPNFYIPDYGSRITSSIYVRGIGARIDQPAVGLNVDNVPILNKDNYDFDLTDIESIEVMRGPQSTLYGRNTIGGLINITTLSPLRFQGLRLRADYGTSDTWRVSAGYYGRLTPRLGMALSINGAGTDGYHRNTYNNARVGAEKQMAARWKTQWRASDNIMFENTAYVSHARQSGYAYEWLQTSRIEYNDTCFYRRTTLTDGLTVKWITDRFTLSSITSFQYIDDNMTLDQDFTPYRYFTLTQKRDEWALTQDLVATGYALGGNYRWLAGVFGFIKSADMSAPVTFFDYGIDRLITSHLNNANPQYPVTWDDDHLYLGSEFQPTSMGTAIYHQSTLNAGRWTLNAGLRVDYERNALDYRSFCSTSYTTWDLTDPSDPAVYRNSPINIDDSGRLSKGFVELLPKLTANYRLPMPFISSVYASIARGYKSGGFNTQMFSDVLQQRLMAEMGMMMRYDIDEIVGYKPEHSWNYEIGAHIECAGGKVRSDLAAFYIDCRNQQLTRFPDGTTTGRIMTNAGRTRSRGLEVSISARPCDHVHASVAYGFTDARFIAYDSGKNDFSGKRVPYAPSHTLFAGTGFTLPVRTSWLTNVRADINVRGLGSIMWNEDNTIRQPFYAQLGASVGFDFKNLSLDLYAENITNTRFSTFYFMSVGNSFVQRGKPRRFEVSLRYTLPTP